MYQESHGQRCDVKGPRQEPLQSTRTDFETNANQCLISHKTKGCSLLKSAEQPGLKSDEEIALELYRIALKSHGITAKPREVSFDYPKSAGHM